VVPDGPLIVAQAGKKKKDNNENNVTLAKSDEK